MDSREEPRDQRLVKPDVRPACAQFVERQRQQAEERGAARQGLVHLVEDEELATAGKYEEPVCPPLVGEHLEPRQQLGYPLDLVEDGPVRVAGEKALRVLLGEATYPWRLQIHVCEVGECRPAERGFPRLPRPGHGDERVLAKEPLKVRRDGSRNHGVGQYENAIFILSIALRKPPPVVQLSG